MNEKFYDGTCSTVRALAQPYKGWAGWSDQWAVGGRERLRLGTRRAIPL